MEELSRMEISQLEISNSEALALSEGSKLHLYQILAQHQMHLLYIRSRIYKVLEARSERVLCVKVQLAGFEFRRRQSGNSG